MDHFQVRSQKGRNIRDHTLVLHAVLHEARCKKLNIDVTCYGIGQCFDALWLHEVINDLYDSGVRNSSLNLLFEGNSKARMSVKTVFGPTERALLENPVIQFQVHCCVRINQPKIQIRVSMKDMCTCTTI